MYALCKYFQKHLISDALTVIVCKINTWGYSTINFFAPMSRYASNGGGPVNASQEFKQMVKAFHDAGIEVEIVTLIICSLEKKIKSND